MTTDRRIRSGYLLLSVLVCLAVVMALGTAWLRNVGLERAHIRADVCGAQAELLATSGLSRAQARLAANPGYEGETWRINGDDLPSGEAVVIITVDAASDKAEARRVEVVAEYPASVTLRARRSRQALHLSSVPQAREENSP
jgi:hypothetical protein